TTENLQCRLADSGEGRLPATSEAGEVGADRLDVRLLKGQDCRNPDATEVRIRVIVDRKGPLLGAVGRLATGMSAPILECAVSAREWLLSVDDGEVIRVETRLLPRESLLASGLQIRVTRVKV